MIFLKKVFYFVMLPAICLIYSNAAEGISYEVIDKILNTAVAIAPNKTKQTLKR